MSTDSNFVQYALCHVTECGRAPVADCKPPIGEWRPVCQEHQDDAWERGWYIRAHQEGCY